MRAGPEDFEAAERLLARPSDELLDFYQNVVQAARRVAPLDAFYLCRVEHEAGILRFVYLGEDDLYGPGEVVPIGAGPTSRAVKSGQAVVLADDASRIGLRMNPFGDEGTASKGALHVPMWIDADADEPPDAVLSVQSRTASAYRAEHLSAVEWLASQVAAFLRDHERRVRAQ